MTAVLGECEPPHSSQKMDNCFPLFISNLKWFSSVKMNSSFLSFALFCSITMFQAKTVDSVITGTLATPSTQNVGAKAKCTLCYGFHVGATFSHPNLYGLIYNYILLLNFRVRLPEWWVMLDLYTGHAVHSSVHVRKTGCLCCITLHCLNLGGVGLRKYNKEK